MDTERPRYHRLDQLAQFDAAVRNKCWVVVQDVNTGDTLHHLPCTRVTREQFVDRVVQGAGRHGSFYVVLDAATGRRHFSPDGCPLCGTDRL
jgi:hypothetical protein